MVTIIVIMLPICLITMFVEFLMKLPERRRERRAAAFLRAKYGSYYR